MKFFYFLTAAFFVLASCNNEAKTESTGDSSTTIPAISPDSVPSNPNVTPVNEARACNTVAGEIWSTLKQGCIVLTDFTKIDPKDPSLDPGRPAYLVFDSARVEIFLPTQDRPVIIRKSANPGEAEMWISGPLTLRQVDGKYILEDEGKILYETGNQ